MAKKRVPIYGLPRQFADVETEATKGATLGRDLYGPDGKLLTPEQVINSPAPSGNNSVRTLWRFIQEIPGNIKALAALEGSGLLVRGEAGQFYLRVLDGGDGIQITQGNGSDGNPTVALTEAVLALLELADTAVQEVQPGTGVTVDNTDPRRPVVSAAGGGGGSDELYPQMTDQAGDPLVDQQGNPIRQNEPGVPWAWIYDEPDFQPLDDDLTQIAALSGAGWLYRSPAGVWSLVAEPVKPVYALTALPAPTPYPREIYVSGTSGVSGIIPAYSDGAKWLRFTDNTEVN